MDLPFWEGMGAPAKSTAGAANYKGDKGEREERRRYEEEIGGNRFVRWGVRRLSQRELGKKVLEGRGKFGKFGFWWYVIRANLNCTKVTDLKVQYHAHGS
jgi:hypothetical protein